MPATLAKELTVNDLAKERGVSPRTIRRWLHRLNARTGGKTVFRDGDGKKAPLKTTMRALWEANPRLVEMRDLEVEKLAVEMRRVSTARIRASVQQAVKDLSAEVDDRLRCLESQSEKVVRLAQLAFSFGQPRTGTDTPAL